MQHRYTLVAAAAAVLAGAGIQARAQTVITQEMVQAGSGSGFFYDAPGYPYTITRRGHYVLGENLVVPAGKVGIEIAVTGVTLDLNGFSVTTSALCTRLEATGTVFCDMPALGQTGVLIKEGSSVVRNGRVSGFSHGVQYKVADNLENLLIENSLRGVYSTSNAGASTLISGVRVQMSRESGIHAYNALVRGSSSGLNGFDGFALGNSTVLDSMALKNNGAGFRSLSPAPLAVGRNTSLYNKQGDYANVESLGQNIGTNLNVY